MISYIQVANIIFYFSIISLCNVIFMSSKVSCNAGFKRTVIITGANRGIGLATTKILASTNRWNIIAACKSPLAAANAFDKIEGKDNIIIRKLDLADLNSVQSFVTDIEKSSISVNVLACNAGIQLSGSGKVPQRTKQGYEATIGINHIGHFHLANLLLNNIRKSGDDPRIVFVGSGVHNPDEKGGNVGSKATLGDMVGLQQGFKEPISMVDNGNYDGDKAYKDSKLCNVMTALELSRRLKNSKVTANVMNPGLIPTTGLFRDLNPLFTFVFTILTRYVFKVAVSEEIGGQRLAFMISDPSLKGRSGLYFSGDPQLNNFEPCKPSNEAQSEVNGKKIWNLTEKLIKSA